MASDRKTRPLRADGEFLAALIELRRSGRIGMTESDHFGAEFSSYPVPNWSKREVKNRLTYLRGVRGGLQGAALADNTRKIAKYRKELFRRESAANQKKERDEYNAKQRRKRAKVKRKAQILLEEKWFEDRKAKRKALKNNRTQQAKNGP